MSIWADIHKRSNGLAERKEDIAVKEEQKESNDFPEEQESSHNTVWATYLDGFFEDNDNDNDKGYDSFSFGKYYHSIWEK